MFIDTYTKVVLTVAAAALMVIAARPVLVPEPAFARADDELTLLSAIDASLAEIAEDTALLAAIGTNVAAISEDAALLEQMAADSARIREILAGIARADFPCTNRQLCGGPQ